MGNNEGAFSTGRQSPALRSSLESSSNNSAEGGPRSTGELSPITSPSPSPSSPEPNTTNALPPSFLAATLPGAPRGDGDDDTISRSPSVLVNPPGSTTSLSSPTSDVSVASSYQIEAQQPPYTEVQAAEDDGEATEDDEDRGIFLGGKGHHLGGLRSSSPVGSLFVEPGSKAPSTIGDEDEQEPREINDAPLTPRAEHFRELSLEDSVEAGDTTLQDLDEDFKTPPAANEEAPFSAVGLQLDPEEEIAIEDSEMVPVLEEKEKEQFEEQLEELNNGSPQVEIGGEAAVEAKVETWAEEVAEAADTKEKVEEVEAEPVVVDAEEVRGPETSPAEIRHLDEGEPTPPAPSSSLPDFDSTSTQLPPPSIEVEHSPEVVQQVVEVSQAPLEGEVRSIAPTDEFVSPPSPVQELAIPIAVAAAFEQEKKDRGISDDEEKPTHPTSDFVPVKDAVVEQEEPKEEVVSASSLVDASEPALEHHSPTSFDIHPPSSSPTSALPPLTSNIPEDPTSDDEELSSPIPGSFPGSPTHSSFTRSPSRSSSLARASFTLEDLDAEQAQDLELPSLSSSSAAAGLEVELPTDHSPQPSPALDMSFISSFPSVPTTTTPQPSSNPHPTEEADRPSTPPPQQLGSPSSIPFPHAKTPEQSEMTRSTSMRSTKPTKSPLELDSDDEDVAAAGDGKVTLISRERYS